MLGVEERCELEPASQLGRRLRRPGKALPPRGCREVEIDTQVPGRREAQQCALALRMPGALPGQRESDGGEIRDRREVQFHVSDGRGRRRTGLAPSARIVTFCQKRCPGVASKGYPSACGVQYVLNDASVQLR